MEASTCTRRAYVPRTFAFNMAFEVCHRCLHIPPIFLAPRITLYHVPKREIRSITNPPRHSRFNRGHKLPILTSSTTAALKRKEATTPLRTGALGFKKGMTAVYDTETGRRSACTVVQMDRVQVVAHKTLQKNGYYAVQVGIGWRQPRNVTRPLLGHYAENGVSPKKHLVEFKVRDKKGLLGIGEIIGASWFQEGQYIDAKANCRGMGFAGVMKKHGFHGQNRSHGVSLTHRSMGSAGPSQGGGSRVYPGKKMAGRMGGQQVTTQNVKVLQVDEENGIIVLHGMVTRLPPVFQQYSYLSAGCIAGPKGALVKISDALKKPWPDIPLASPTEAAVEPLRALA